MRISDKSVSEILPISIVCREINMTQVLPEVLKNVVQELPLCRPSVKIAPFMPVSAVTENETADVIFSYKSDVPAQSRIIYKELKNARCAVCAVKTANLLKRTK